MRLSVWRAPSSLIAIGRPEGCRFDFSVGIPDWESFPLAVWRRLSARALRSAARAPAGYGDPEGRPELREAIARHISFARAIACSAGEIVVTAGAQQAFDLITHSGDARQDDRAERNGYRPAKRSERGRRELVSIPSTVKESVDRLPRNAKVICVTPSHQFPLGVHLSLARRKALLDFARAHGAVIVEDDYDGEFRYAGKPLDALQTLDRGEAVFYVGTFSKSLFPALRLGFVIAPPWARHALVAAKQLSDWHAPVVAQDILSAFISEGHLARHVRKMRRLYSERREILQNALQRFCGRHLRVVGIGAGLHLTTYLDHSLSASDLIHRAREAGIVLDAMQRFSAADRKSEGLVFGYGAICSRRIGEAVRRLAGLMR
jgi:GntR family transcriptional regulator/MocR family aminotransferase